MKKRTAPILSVHAFRLKPGEDLKKELFDWAVRNKIKAAIVLGAVGSLKPAKLRYAGRKKASVLRGPLEICALSGTISPDGLHLHLVVSDKNGRTFGGHVLEGSLINTTAELVLGELPEFSFARRTDPATGFKELAISKPGSSFSRKS